MNLDRWAERIYAEKDFGRSAATSLAGAIGLIIYLYTNDWVIAAFSGVIAFPIARVAASAAHKSYARRRHSDADQQRIKELFDRFSEDEKQVLREFVKIGGSVMSWSHANRLSLPEPAVASLMQREVLYATMTPDGMREAFAINVEIFDLAQKAYAQETDF